MILTWMLAAALFALLVGVAARALESAARLASWQGRAPWAVAIGVSVAWPVLTPLIARQRPVMLAPLVVNAGAVQAIGRRLPSAVTGVASRLDAPLVVAWVAVTLLLVTRVLLAQRQLARISRAARPAEMDGHEVLVTNGIGPAVVGIAVPRIAVPAWLAELDAPLRELVLRHEREHCRARDTMLLWLGEMAVVVMPWNPAVWWQARRLRLALELDCDARTLGDTEGATTYGKLLLLIAQRQQMTRLAPMLAESNSHLSQRIRAMSGQPVSNRRVRTALLGVVAVGAIVAACSSRVGSDLTSPRPIGGKLAATALEPSRQGVYFEYQVEHQAMSVPGSPAPKYPDILKAAGVEGETIVSFVVDTRGIADPLSLRILKTTHQLFADAVSAALPNMRFTPALVGGKPVKQLVMQPFVFNMMGAASANEAAPASGAVITRPGNGKIATIPQVTITGMPQTKP